ncbi:MAG: hypothetical protein F4227_04210 [Gammaproteobacteria bacterium]|nr:hypothetical protein [Gammaproteobacteria bacterium]MYF02179.1 hypothetical protein [Gammaproteobacteria bacterium]MYI78008.1 hypothetical protein [Gammaproteobacteria bacterium]
MKLKRVLTNWTCLTLGCLSLCTIADDEYEAKQQYVTSNLGWFGSGATIQELRDRSTKTFELLDQDNSSSITFDEIDLSEMESEVPDMNNEELREYSRRVNAIHSKFMNWTTEFDEFEVVDSNSDGVWNRDEYEVRHQNLQSHRLELGLKEWDTDENGAVELHEFNSHLDELELLDENADGTVSHQEAFKSKDDNVISDVLNKLKLDEMIWASVKAVNTDIEAEAEAKATRYMFIKQKEADKVDK